MDIQKAGKTNNGFEKFRCMTLRISTKTISLQDSMGYHTNVASLIHNGTLWLRPSVRILHSTLKNFFEKTKQNKNIFIKSGSKCSLSTSVQHVLGYCQ